MSRPVSTVDKILVPLRGLWEESMNLDSTGLLCFLIRLGEPRRFGIQPLPQRLLHIQTEAVWVTTAHFLFNSQSRTPTPHFLRSPLLFLVAISL